MERRELAAWLRLTLTPGVGCQGARKLLAAFALPEAIFEQPRSALAQVCSAPQAQALATEPAGLARLTEVTWAWLHGRADPGQPARQILALGDPRYPAGLLDIDEPPLLLYLLGDEEFLHAASHDGAARSMAEDSIASRLRRSVAIVGSRNPTPQGSINARAIARALAESGVVIVSGLALGIDAAAHEGALDGAANAGYRLATIAVVGTGLDRVYPTSHHELAHRVAENGLLVSEYPLGTPPIAANFPRRNRIIAGLSQGTLVVEAALHSGSLITARLAAEQGKEVFAIPGSIHSTQSRGCHALIRQGAKLVESAQDVLEELGAGPGLARSAPVPDAQAHGESGAGEPHAEDPLLLALGNDPIGLDALQARTGLPTAQLQARLMALELERRIARLAGGLFQRIHHA